MRRTIGALMFCIAGTVGAQTPLASSGLFAIGALGIGQSGGVVSASMVAKSSWFAFTVAPLRLNVHMEDGAAVTVYGDIGAQPTCGNYNAGTNSTSTGCRAFQVTWSALADAAVRVPGMPLYIGAGVGATATSLVPIGSAVAYVRQDSKMPVVFRLTVGQQFFGAELGATVRLR